MRNHDQSKPKLLSLQIVIEFYKRGEGYRFTSKDVSKLFGISITEACVRLGILRKFGCIKEIRPKTRPATYELSSWGIRYAKRKVAGS